MTESKRGTRDEQVRDLEVENLLKAYGATRDVRLREKLIIRHLGLVAALAKRLSRDGQQTEDLIQVGYIGLIKAVDRFDPSRGTRFCTYAVPTIVGEIKRYLRDKSKAIRLPRHLQERIVVVERTAADLTQRLGRSPTIAEIAAEIDLAPEDVALLREQTIHSPLSLDKCLEPDDGEASPPIVLAIDHDDELLRMEDRFVLARALENLTPRERAILYFLFYADLSQAQVGRKLNISQMHVSRLARTALSRLREELDESA